MEKDKAMAALITSAEGYTPEQLRAAASKLRKLVERGERAKLQGEWVDLDIMIAGALALEALAEKT